jgi:hypothetical protein
MVKILFVLFFSVLAFALTDVDRQELVNKNILMPFNPGFESGKSNWTASGGTFNSVTAGSNLMIGLGSATWDSSAASQTLRSKLVTIPKGLYGANGLIQCKVQVPSGTATHKFRVTDGTNAVGEQNLISTTLPFNQSLNFPIPTSGSLQIEFLSVAADEPLIAIDDCYIGSATNLTNVSQAEFYGSQKLVGASLCEWNVSNSSTYLGTSADTDCNTPVLEGFATTTAGKRPAISFNSLPSGRYKITASFVQDITATGVICGARISDGTNTTPQMRMGQNSSVAINVRVLEGEFVYNTAQGAKVFEVQMNNASGTAGTCQITANTTNSDVFIQVYRFPLASQIAYNANLVPWYIDASIGGSSFTLATVDTATPTTPNAATITLSNAAGALETKVTCSSTNPPTGTTCAAGNEETGINFNLPIAGAVEVCAQFTEEVDTNASGQLYSQWQWSETANNSQTPIQVCGKATGAGQDGGASGARDDQIFPISVCSICNFGSAGEKTLRLQYTQEVAGTVNSHSIINGNPGGTGPLNVKIIAKPITQGPMPVLLAHSDLKPLSWSGFHAQSDCSWARTNTALGDPTADASCTFTELTNQNFGTVTSALSAGNKLPGITFTPPRVGRYKVCAVTQQSTSDANPGVYASLTDGTTPIAQVAWDGQLAGGYRFPYTLCGIFNAIDTSQKTIKIQTAVSSGTTTITSGSVNAYVISWSIFALDQSFPMPYYGGTITNSGGNQVRVEAATLTCSGSSAINNQMNGASWVSSIGNISGGECAVTLASGVFTATPFCFVERNASSVTTGQVFSVGHNSATSLAIDCEYDDGANNWTPCVSFGIKLMCIGTK